MATLTVRNVPDDAKHRFRQVAAAHGRSMEEHLRHLIIDAGLDDDAPTPTGVREVSPSFRPAPVDPRAAGRARIERLVELGRGLDWEPEPRPFESFTDMVFDPKDFE